MECKKKSLKIIVYGICITVGIASLFPIYYTFINSIRDVYSTPATLLPKGYEWENFKLAVTLIPFFKYLGNLLKLLKI